MTEISSMLLLGLGELLLVTTVVSAVLVFAILNKKTKDKIAAQVLISRIKEDAQQRLSETHKIMEGQYGFAGDELKEIVAKIDREEKLFYQNLINVYLKRDHKSFENLNVDFEGSVETYRTLEIPERGSSDDEGGASAEEVEGLKSEIEILKTELKITMDAMGNMLAEYAAVFSSDGTPPPPQESWGQDTSSESDQGASDDDALMSLDAEGDDDALMNLDAEDDDDALMNLDAEDDDSVSLDESEEDIAVNPDDIADLLALDEGESDVNPDVIDDLLALDEESKSDDELMNLDDDQLFDLDDKEDSTATDDETVVLSQDDIIDDPDLLLDQIRAEDEIK